MIERIARTHAEAIEAMKDQLLIVLVERFGGEAMVSAAEIDATGDRNLLMGIIDADTFHFTVRRKGDVGGANRDSIDIARASEKPSEKQGEKQGPDYDEH